MKGNNNYSVNSIDFCALMLCFRFQVKTENTVLFVEFDAQESDTFILPLGNLLLAFSFKVSHYL